MNISKNNSKKNYYFFIGTQAELIKFLPVLKEFQNRKIPFTIIASGQNNILRSQLLSVVGNPKIDIVLFKGQIKQSAWGLLFWFLTTLPKGILQLRSVFSNINKKKSYLMVHGDTISAVMGVIIGRLYGLQIAHIEAGLRSFNYFHPFPEELDRTIVSRFANIHFCPNEWAMNNLKKISGKKVNTQYNTLIESLSIALAQKVNPHVLNEIGKAKYFVFVMHRQENLMNERLVNFLIRDFLSTISEIKCVFILHGFTRATLERLHLMETLKKNTNIFLTHRLNYIEFMKVLKGCEYIITDGGSNQEECYYLGKPTLLLRHVTERIEGLEENVVISKNNTHAIKNFISKYKQFRRPSQKPKVKPSVIIVNYLLTL